jgi:hypothetical protein
MRTAAWIIFGVFLLAAGWCAFALTVFWWARTNATTPAQVADAQYMGKLYFGCLAVCVPVAVAAFFVAVYYRRKVRTGFDVLRGPTDTRVG